MMSLMGISYIRTLYAFTNETLAKYSYATSLQDTLRHGILISLVQDLGLSFTYELAICSYALQLWVGWILILHKKANSGEIITALFAVILRGLKTVALVGRKAYEISSIIHLMERFYDPTLVANTKHKYVNRWNGMTVFNQKNKLKHDCYKSMKLMYGGKEH